MKVAALLLSLAALPQSAPIDGASLVVQSAPAGVHYSMRPDGSLFTVAGRAGIQLWSRRGRLIRTIDQYGQAFNQALNPRHDLIAAFDRLLDLEGAVLAELGPKDGYRGQGYYWSPDGEHLARVTPLGYHLYTREGEWLAHCRAFPEVLEFVPDRDEIYVARDIEGAGGRRGRLELRDFDGELLREIPIDEQGLVRGVAASSDGDNVLVWQERRAHAGVGPGSLVSIWTREGKFVRDLITGSGSASAAFALADGGWLTVHDHELVRWSTDGEPLATRADRWVHAAADESLIGYLTGESARQQGTCVRLFDLNGDVITDLPYGQPAIHAVAASPVADVLALLDSEGEIRVWKLTGETIGRFRPLDEQGEPLYARGSKRPMAFSRDGRSLILWRKSDEKYGYRYLTRYSLAGERIEERRLDYGDVTAAQWIARWMGPGRRMRGIEAIPLPDGRRILQPGTLMQVKPIDDPQVFWQDWIEDNMAGTKEVAFSPDGTRMYVRKLFDLEVRDASDGRLISKQRMPNSAKNLAVDPSGRHLACFGTDESNRVALLDTEGNVSKEMPHPEVRSLAGMRGPVFTSDGRGVVTAGENGTVRVWLWETDEAVTYLFSGDEWIMYTDDGLFDGSRRGGSLLGMTRGARSYSIDQFALANNRPDRILERLGVGTDVREASGERQPGEQQGGERGLSVAGRGRRAATRSLIEHFRAQFERRLRRAGLTEEQLASPLHAPDIRIVATRVEDGRAELDVRASDSLLALRSLRAWVGGVPVLERALEGTDFEGTIELELGVGRNDIEVAVLNERGVESLRALTSLSGIERGPGRLRVIALGVSDYLADGLDLAYADRDALDLAERLSRGAAGRYEGVRVDLFVNEQVTRERIAALVDSVREMSLDDSLVLFVAGHGLHDTDAAATWYYLTHETELGRLAETAVPFAELQRLLAESPARSKLFLMDTCESGEREEDWVTSAAPPERLRARTSKRLSERRESSAATSAVRAVDRDRYIFYDLSRRSGAIVLSSSRGSEFSYEDDAIKNGWFTEVVLEALSGAGRGADTNADGWVDTTELRSYVGPRVAERTGGRQHPTVDRDNVHRVVRLPVR